MELKQLESYVAVVKFGSFTKAAEKLYVSQPTISTHIQMLEMELQTKLLNRHTKSLEVTAKGKELYDCASEMLATRDRLLKNWADEESKTIHLGSSTIPSTYVLPELLSQYKKENPDVQFIIHQGDSQDVIDGLINGNFQVGFVGMEVDMEGVTCVPFFEDKIVLVTAAIDKYKEVHEQYEACKDLKIICDLIRNEPMIVRESGSGSKKYAEYVLRDLEIEENELNVCASLNDSESIKNMVIGNLGIALISEKAVAKCNLAEEILVFEIPLKSSIRNLNIVYKEKEIYRPYENLFVDYVTRYYIEK